MTDVENSLAYLPKWQLDVVAAAREFGHEVKAAELAGVSVEAVRNMRRINKEFDAAMCEALQIPHGRLFAVMLKRALEGDEEPLVDARKGVLLDSANRPIMIKKYSDRIQIEMAKAIMPETFREPRNAPVGADGQLVGGPRVTIEKLFAALSEAKSQIPNADESKPQ